MNCTRCQDCPAQCLFGKCPLADIEFPGAPDLVPAEPAPPTRYGVALLVIWAIGMACVLLYVASGMRSPG